ncbi:hypothetical protein [Posidoniimonas polymericola]|nr:hypothetical protein [Posidoniimonas polymericola]
MATPCCAGCQHALDWPAPIPGVWAAPVACGQCGRVYYTRVDANLAPCDSLPADCESSARGLGRQFQPRDIAAVAAKLGVFPDVLIPGVPLDAGLKIHDATIEARLIELTTAGCRLQIEASLKVGYLLLDFARLGFPGLQALAAVRRLQLERDAMRVGCEFLTGMEVEAALRG